jgi:hypothetical protein
VQTNSLQPTINPDKPANFYRYRGWIVASIIIAYIFFWVAIAIGYSPVSDLAFVVLFAEIAFTLVMDANGVVSLRGRLFRSRPPKAITIALGIVYVVLSLIWLIPYLIVASLDAWRPRAEVTAEHYERIAQMEGVLGILPTAEGSCPNCHKPLQLGAEFCAYCGAPMAPAPRLCPVCHARTFPDAQWCPECGAALPPMTSSATKR